MKIYSNTLKNGYFDDSVGHCGGASLKDKMPTRSSLIERSCQGCIKQRGKLNAQRLSLTLRDGGFLRGRIAIFPLKGALWIHSKMRIK